MYKTVGTPLGGFNFGVLVFKIEVSTRSDISYRRIQYSHGDFDATVSWCVCVCLEIGFKE